MEKLSEQQRANVSKMSDARLRSKLAAAGYNPDDLAKLDRSALVGAWVDLIVKGLEPSVAEAKEDYPELVQVERPDASGGSGRSGGTGGSGGTGEMENVNQREMSLEERRLVLEERRLEKQKLQREKQRLQKEQKERRWAREV